LVVWVVSLVSFFLVGVPRMPPPPFEDV